MIKRKFPRGKYILKKALNKNGESALYLRYYVSSHRVMFSSGIFIRPNEWDPNLQVVKTIRPHYKTLNSNLKKLKSKIDECISIHDGAITPEIVRSIFFSGEKEPDFIRFALDYNEKDYILEKKSYSSFDNHRSHIGMFKNYIALTTGDSFLPMSRINANLLESYKIHCRRCGNQKESINKKLTPLLKAIKYAVATEIIPSRIAAQILEDGYLPLKNTKYNSTIQKEKTRYLTGKQLQEFSNLYHTAKYKRTKDYIDIFMFSFYVCGMRFADLLTLEWRHIDWKNKLLNKNVFKSKECFTIPIVEPAMEILERWKSKESNSRFVFDLLPYSFDLKDEAILNKLRKSKNRALHTSLGTLGVKLNLSFSLSIHVARHTFAVMALNHGTSKSMLSKLMTHKSVTATEKTYAVFFPDTIKEEVLSNLNFDFSPKSISQ